MLQLVDYWTGGYNDSLRYGILDTDNFTLNYYTKEKIDNIISNGIQIKGLITTQLYEIDRNDTSNKYITRVITNDYSKVKQMYRATISYTGIRLVLNRPIKLGKLINGVNFEYKDVRFYYKNMKPYGRFIEIKQQNWKDEHLKIIEEILSMFDYSVLIEYPFRVNQGNHGFTLQPLLNILKNKKFRLNAINWDTNYKAIESIDMGAFDFSKVTSFINLLGSSLNLKYVDFSNSVNDMNLFNDCIVKNNLVGITVDKIQDALNTFLYNLNYNKNEKYIVFILKGNMKGFAEFLCSDNRVVYIGNVNKDNNIYKNIDRLISKFVLIHANSYKTNLFLVFC